ncbi:NAD(P)H-hydrate dehydratase [Clostridium tarantellae]|uniref:Bifunctional NAD(P)H-hydrate repair enzyme n=1 Tax=Clostridium tarantellae TaxID=39493 RepID=A0A6I1MLZ7_9CLOT|nr:NAD(P)H-hydrate dehydratase [Clostridium tarantellae]MPQ43137.1 NAD(P)H-hydrate dehydratase [Clostridium tarantellae]
MKIGTAQSIKDIDKMSIEIGIPSMVLMENASLKVLKNLDLKKSNYTVVAGPGNNGGDALALARHLICLGKNVDIFLINAKNRFSKDCRQNYQILKNINANIINISHDYDFTNIKESLILNDITIDGIFGIGLSKEVTGIYKHTIDLINKYSKNIVSIDIPSGMNSDNGNIEGTCVKANKTITFEIFKKGFLNYGNSNYLGEVILEHIGIPRNIIRETVEDMFLTTKDFVKEHMIKRERYMHKGNFGKIVLFSGISGFSGAAYICTEAAVKSGAGLVTLCCDKDIQSILSSKLIEAMTCNFEQKDLINKLIKSANAIAIGPGMGNNSNTLNLLISIIDKGNCPIVIDADGINVLKDNINLLTKSKNKIIITPHPGEMSRLTGYSVEYINNNRIDVAKEFAKKYNIIILLKGYYTVITDGDKVYINPTGNSAMASGGMGDCLTGIISSMIGQGLFPLEATVISAYIHGYIGEKLSKNNYSVTASDIIKNIQRTIKDLIIE